MLLGSVHYLPVGRSDKYGREGFKILPCLMKIRLPIDWKGAGTGSYEIQLEGYVLGVYPKTKFVLCTILP